MTLGERIGQRLKELDETGKNVAGLAVACGVTPSAVYQWMDGTSKGMKPENLVVTADYLQTHERWLVFGQGPKDRRVKMTDLEPDEEALIQDYKRLAPEEQEAILKTVTNLANRLKQRRGRGKLPLQGSEKSSRIGGAGGGVRHAPISTGRR